MKSYLIRLMDSDGTELGQEFRASGANAIDALENASIDGSFPTYALPCVAVVTFENGMSIELVVS